ncbi:MAG: hypothetical protein GY870_16495 [archaeon]|nr:hypothetical protein [archaeon]
MRRLKFSIIICLLALFSINNIDLGKAAFKVSNNSESIDENVKFNVDLNITGSNPTDGGSSFSIIYNLYTNVSEEYNVSVEMKIAVRSWCPMLPNVVSTAFTNNHVVGSSEESKTENYNMVYGTLINFSLFWYKDGSGMSQYDNRMEIHMVIDSDGVPRNSCAICYQNNYDTESGQWNCISISGYNIEIILGSIFVMSILLFMINRKKNTFRIFN